MHRHRMLTTRYVNLSAKATPRISGRFFLRFTKKKTSSSIECCKPAKRFVANKVQKGLAQASER